MKRFVALALLVLAGCAGPKSETVDKARPEPAASKPAPSPSSGGQAEIGKLAPAIKVAQWLNTSDKALVLADLRGKVVVLDFWTYW